MELKNITDHIDREKVTELLISAAAVGAGFLLRKGLESGYEKAFDEKPPNVVDNRDLNWGKMIGWTILSGVAAMGIRVLVKRYGGQTFQVEK